MTEINKKETYCYYIRVSTKMQEDRRTFENQKMKIEEYSERNKLTLSDCYRDTISGASKDKPEFNKMISVISQYKGVIVAFIDRLGRNVVEQMRMYVAIYDAGVEIHIADFGEINQNSLDDQLKYMIEMYFGVKELDIIRKRIVVGIERHKKEYGTWGPKRKEIDLELYKRLRQQGVSKSAAARLFNVSRTTLYGREKELEKKRSDK